MIPFLPYLFAFNVFLTLVDAAIGYHAAPVLVRLGAANDEDAGQAVRWVRKLLTGVVALYMFFSCLAFFRGQPTFLLVVTAVIIIDIVTQLVISRKMRTRENP
jgi:uncharacterized sodium:solute symporter family permease YidK